MAVNFEQRWVYVSTNLLFDRNADALANLIREARDAGATHIFLNDYQTGLMADLPPHYFANVARVRKAAADSGVTICPVIFPIGSSSRYLYHNPNLADGIPVRNMRFVVKGAIAQVEPSLKPDIANSGFDESAAGTPSAWKVQGFNDVARKDGLVSIDTEVKHSGAGSLKVTAVPGVPDDDTPLVGASQVVKVRPFHLYTLSVWIKTDGIALERHPVQVFGARDHRQLCYSFFMKDPALYWPPKTGSTDSAIVESASGAWVGGGVDPGMRPTGDWAQYKVAFNSLDYSEIELFAGFSSDNTGILWFDDIEIQPAGLLNVLRRDLTPFVVTSADGKVTYVETLDFKRVEDPMLGVAPSRGDFMAVSRGTYDIWHRPPAIHLTPDSRIKEGDTILVSFYTPGIIYSKQQVTVSLSEPAVFDLMEEEMRWVSRVWQSPSYMMHYDEIRSCGWEEQPGEEHLGPGKLLARHVSRAIGVVRKYAPEAEIYVWSDMFDPYHNAGELPEGRYYYFVNGSWAGSWDGLSKDVVIFKWGGAKPIRESTKWFSDRGHRQVLSGFPVDRWLALTDGLPNIIGFSYTVWNSDYSGMKDCFRELREWKGATGEAGTQATVPEE